MYSVVTEQCSPIFGNFDWYKIIGPRWVSSQAYLNQKEADKICEKLNSQKRVTKEEIALIRSKAEEKRLQKIVDKLES